MIPKYYLRPFIFISLSFFSLAFVAVLTTLAKYEQTTRYAITDVERISVSANGEEGNGPSREPAISADGRYVTFHSTASNLVMSDTNGSLGWDVFMIDRETGTIRRVSVSSTGEEGNNFSYVSDLSDDGRFVTFYSGATNLVISDTNNWWDVFVHDTWTGVTELVSLNSQGVQAQNGGSGIPSISADGRYIAFSSNANNLVSGDTNGVGDIFVRDRQLGETERVSVNSGGTQANLWSESPSISGDGRFVAFDSSASNLVASDMNGDSDVFVHDRITNQTICVSVNSTGEAGNNDSYNPVISLDGRYIAFHSYATNLVPNDTNGQRDVFVHDRFSGQTKRLSISSIGEEGNGESRTPSISSDGRFIAFHSYASNLVINDTNNEADIFVHDQQTGLTVRLNMSEDGIEGNSYSYNSAVASECLCVAFQSNASNLVQNDLNNVEDVFMVKWQMYSVFLPVIVYQP